MPPYLLFSFISTRRNVSTPPFSLISTNEHPSICQSPKNTQKTRKDTFPNHYAIFISHVPYGFTVDSRFDPFIGPPWIEAACGVWQGGLNPKRSNESIESPEPEPDWEHWESVLDLFPWKLKLRSKRQHALWRCLCRDFGRSSTVYPSAHPATHHIASHYVSEYCRWTRFGRSRRYPEEGRWYWITDTRGDPVNRKCTVLTHDDLPPHHNEASAFEGNPEQPDSLQ